MHSKKKIILIFIFFIFFTWYFLSVVYSAMFTTVNINGSAYARIYKEVRITDFKMSSLSSNATSAYEEFNTDTIMFKFNLLSNTSVMYYDVEITNFGTSNVAISQIIGEVPSGVSYEIVDYALKDKICDDTGKCNNGAITKFKIKFSGTQGEYAFSLNFEFKNYYEIVYEDISVDSSYPVGALEGENVSITFNQSLQRIQFFMNDTEVSYYKQLSNGQVVTINNVTSDILVKKKPYVAKLIRGKVDTVGSEICIEEECFYVVSSNSSTVTMLSKYNLHVGNNVTAYNVNTGVATKSAITNPTGRQDSTALGTIYRADENNVFPWVGIVPFSSSTYWWNSYSNKFNSGYPNDFTISSYSFPYVYNSSSNLYSHFNNYKNYLIGLDVEINDVRAIKGNELISLGCDLETYSCGLAPDWVRATAYWAGTALNEDKILFVSETFFVDDVYNDDIFLGIRPVVEIPKSEIQQTPEIPASLTIKSGRITTMGSEVCIGNECFYVVYTDDDKVYLFAKYNLQVGYNVTAYNQYTGKYTKTKISNPTGLQDSTAIGARGTSETNPTFPFIGTDAFSTSAYWWSSSSNAMKTGISHNYVLEGEGVYYVYNNGSNLYNYMTNYKTYLESLGVVIDYVAPLSSSELYYVACQYSSSCEDLPSWMYSTSYWLGSAQGDVLGAVFSGYGFTTLGDGAYASNEILGVRPAISIPRSMFN